MKKLILIPLLLLFSCAEDKIQPIEKYKGVVVVSEPNIYNYGRSASLRVKTKDSVFYIYITPFDAKNLKEGDTIN